MSNFSKAAYYRNMAKRVAAVAVDIASPETRDELLKIAAQFELLAKHAETKVPGQGEPAT